MVEYGSKNVNNKVNNNYVAGYDSSNNPSPVATLFNFEQLFGVVKKKTPDSTLQNPSPTARSILLVLHAETVPENPTVVSDIDRQLTPKGERDAEGLGVYLKEHKIPEPDWIFSSPSER